MKKTPQLLVPRTSEALEKLTCARAMEKNIVTQDLPETSLCVTLRMSSGRAYAIGKMRRRIPPEQAVSCRAQTLHLSFSFLLAHIRLIPIVAVRLAISRAAILAISTVWKRLIATVI